MALLKAIVGVILIGFVIILGIFVLACLGISCYKALKKQLEK
jgi:hypothetical protein